LLLAALSGLLLYLSLRLPLLAWLAMAPLFVGLRAASSVRAGVYGFLVGVFPAAAVAWGLVPGGRLVELMVILGMALGYAAVMALGAWLWRGRPTCAALVIFPVVLVAAQSIMELLLGRFVNPTAMSLATWTPAVHVAQLGSELLLTGLTAVSAAVLATCWLERRTIGRVALPVGAAAAVVVGALGWGAWSHGTVGTKLESAVRVKVAAVADDLGQHDPLQDYAREDRRRDVALVLRTYESLVARAAQQGASLVTLPEAHVFVDTATRGPWETEVRRWAAAHGIWLSAGYVDLAQNANRLLLVAPDGSVVSDYEKQHPIPILDFPRHASMAPAWGTAPWGAVSGAICFDRDFADINRAVAARGGILTIPTNDWRKVADLHARLLTWTAVQSQATVVVAATHGWSVITDAAGREYGRASALEGPVVLVAEVPVTAGPLVPVAPDWPPYAAGAALVVLVAAKAWRGTSVAQSAPGVSR
jgi:predicted amidohydrolase